MSTKPKKKCNSCQESRAVRGAKGLAAATLAATTGKDRCCCEDRAARLAACKACEHYTQLGNCGVCGCMVVAKTLLTYERCPLDPPKWEAVS